MLLKQRDENSAVRRAQAALRSTIAAAMAVDPTLKPKDLTTATVTAAPPYAREVRLLISTVAATRYVLAIGTPADGKYKLGAEVTLYGFKTHVADAVIHCERIITHARKIATQSLPGNGEDPGTHRGSVLAGYRIGLTMPGLDADAVRALVATRDPHMVRCATTGSGSWTGYCAAQQHLTELAA